MKSHIKLLANKTWHSVIVQYLLKDKHMEEVVSSMDIVINLTTQETIRHNKYQMRFLDKLVPKEYSDKKLMINAITC